MKLFAAFLLLCNVLSTVQGQCTSFGSGCWSGDTCCSGQCTYTAANNPLNLPGSCTCTSGSESCSSNGECCSNSCNAGHTCGPGMANCKINSDCQSGNCANGQCQCLADGNDCTFYPVGCCSGSCVNNICGGGCIAPGNIGCNLDMGCCGNSDALSRTTCVAGKCCKVDTQYVDCPSTDSNGYAENPICCSGVCRAYTLEGTPTSSCVTSLPI